MEFQLTQLQNAIVSPVNYKRCRDMFLAPLLNMCVVYNSKVKKSILFFYLCVFLFNCRKYIIIFIIFIHFLQMITAESPFDRHSA